MTITNKLKRPNCNYEKQIKDAANLIKKADAIVLGIGSGMSAAGGINYADKKLAERWFPEYAALGFNGLMEIQSVFWNINKDNETAYWGYWSRHINYIRYETPALEPYIILERIMRGRNYFICTTNADGQVSKAGFDNGKIFAPQGNYDVFQCSVPCDWDELFPNKEMIKEMVANINERHEIPKKLVPYCPHCGSYLIPNLRCDDRFVEKPHFYNLKDYEDFVNMNLDNSLLFLELGVGFNTPGIIRYPFERLTYRNKSAMLLRINKGMADVAMDLNSRGIGINADLLQALKDIENIMNG